MKIFVDTNIVSEFLEERKEADLVDRIFEAIEDNSWQKFLSVGSFYTLTYLVERFLRKAGISQPQLVRMQRDILQKLIDAFEIADLDKNSLSLGVKDAGFRDLEDSYQYQAAIKSGCNVLLTINKKDFKEANQDVVKILTPQEFIDEYLLP